MVQGCRNRLELIAKAAHSMNSAILGVVACEAAINNADPPIRPQHCINLRTKVTLVPLAIQVLAVLLLIVVLVPTGVHAPSAPFPAATFQAPST